MILIQLNLNKIRLVALNTWVAWGIVTVTAKDLCTWNEF